VGRGYGYWTLLIPPNSTRTITIQLRPITLPPLLYEEDCMSAATTANGRVYKYDFNDLAPVAIYFKHGPKEYVLREASEDIIVKYQNIQIGAARMAEGKVVGISGLADAEPALVAGCVFEVIYASDGTVRSEKPMTIQEIRTWPHRIVKPLFNDIKEMNGLNEEDNIEVLEARIKNDQERLTRLKSGKDDESSMAKNLQSGTTDTSN
jgi:hypothetical protein